MIREATDPPNCPGIARTAARGRPSYSLWDGETWHQRRRTPDPAAHVPAPLKKRDWAKWNDELFWVYPGMLDSKTFGAELLDSPDPDIQAGIAKTQLEINGLGVPQNLVEYGARLEAYGKALQAPDVTLVKLMALAADAGFKISLLINAAE